MGGSYADARRCRHRGMEVVCQRLQSGIEDCDFGAAAFQGGIGIAADGKYWHGGLVSRVSGRLRPLAVAGLAGLWPAQRSVKAGLDRTAAIG